MSVDITVLNETHRTLARYNTGAPHWTTRRGSKCRISESEDTAVIQLPEHYQILHCWCYANDAGHRQLFIRVLVKRRSRRSA